MTSGSLPQSTAASTAPRLPHPRLTLLLCLQLCFGLLILSGCGRDQPEQPESNSEFSIGAAPYRPGIIPTTPERFAQFYPSRGILPYPNNLLFSGSTDGTLNAPVDPLASNAAMLVPLNTLDGFSTIAPFNADFNVEPDGSSAIAGSTVRVFQVTLAGVGGAVTSVDRELTPDEYSVGLDIATPHGLAIVPKVALAPRTSYLVVMTNGLKDQNGNPFAASTAYALAQLHEPLIDAHGNSRIERINNTDAAGLEPIRQLTVAAESAVARFTPALTSEHIILSWSFTTQSIDDSLLAVRAAINAAPPPPSSLTLFSLQKPAWKFHAYSGTITLPYYLAIPTAADPEAPLTGFWHGPDGRFLTHEHPMPEATVVHPIPLLVTIPKGSKPAGGWPVVIFQHGNTSNRSALIALADTLSTQGFAAVAIDLPMHGITSNEVDDSRGLYQGGLERTFDLDLIDNETSIPGPDGKTDTSGTYFTKLNQVLTTRDNIRQGVADLMGLRRALVTMDYDNGGADFDLNRVHFVGHSLGATVGGVYLGVEAGSDVGASTLGMPGGAIAKQLDGSATSGPSIALGMKENGLEKGTQDYERFLAAVQMVLDSADPLNYAKAAVRDRPLHLIEVVGGADLGNGLFALPDQIVPNNVPYNPGVGTIAPTVASPTGGTDPLWNSMGLSIASGTTSGSNLHVVVRFIAGHHSSLISPFDALGNEDLLSQRVEEEMQLQIASFISSNGLLLTITDPTLVVDH